MTRFNTIFLASVWVAASAVPALARGISCCALGMGAGSMFQVCEYWKSANGCNSLTECELQVQPTHKYVTQWCDYCLNNILNTECTADRLAPFPSHPPPGYKRSVRDVEADTESTHTDGLEDVDAEEFLALLQAAGTEIQTLSTPNTNTSSTENSLERRNVFSQNFNIPQRLPRGSGANIIDFTLGHLKVIVVTTVTGIIQFSLQNLSEQFVAWSFQDNTAVDAQSGRIAPGRSAYFRYTDGAPGDVCVFHSS